MRTGVWRSPGSVRAVFALGLSVLLVGCGSTSSGNSSSSGSAQTPVTVSVGVDPLWLSAPPYVCEAQGICKKHGVNVKPVLVASTAAMVAAIQGGSMDVGVGSLAGELQAYVQGIPVKMLSPNGGLTPDLGAAAVATNSPITSAKQLAGKTFCEQTIGGQAEAQVKYMVQQAGGDPASVKFIGIPYPNMVTALQAGRADACDLESPFYNAALAAHQIRTIGDETLIFGPHGSPVTAYFSSSSFASQNPTAVQRFVAAMTETQQYIASHPKAMRDVLPQFLGVTAAQAATTPVGTFPTKFNVNLLQTVSDRFVTYGLVSKKVNVKQVLWSKAPTGA